MADTATKIPFGWDLCEDYEDSSYFVGTCTCPHGEEEHGWGGCYFYGCPCAAGWEE